MAKYDKPIEEIDQCPHCGSDYGYYQKMYVSGWINYQHKFVTGEGNNHGELYDYLNYSREAKYYCCAQCHERIAKVS